MRLFQWAKDGGEKSHVTGLFVIEIKSLFSMVLLRFRNGTREAYHSHAFNAITWFLTGRVEEHRIYPYPSRPDIPDVTEFTPSLKPKITKRDNMHKVLSFGDTWALSLRGPWTDTWKEYCPETNEYITLTHGRKVVGRCTANLYPH